jgi:hypothetical protein
MKTEDLSQVQALAVRCQICGARPGERCELGSGGLRATPHQDRMLNGNGCGEALTRTSCEIRQTLIGQLSGSASRVFSATTRLNELAGTQNAVAFADARTEARLARKACTEGKASLERHQIVHGC